MTVHLVAPTPHSSTIRAFDVDAYAAKCRRLGTMLTQAGFHVVLYGGPENEAEVAEFVPLVTLEEQQGWFGSFDPMRDTFNTFDTDHPAWLAFNARAIDAIRERMQPGDILGLTMGSSHKPIADALPDLTAVETGIGYSGVFAPFRVYESHAWQHYMAARESIDDLRPFDTVIPNSYEPDEFQPGDGQGGYHLFIGRFIRRKGIEIAVEATRRLGVQLVIAGPGVNRGPSDSLDGIDVRIWSDHVKHVGSVIGKAKAELMGRATAVWTPTVYLEPFGGVAVEAMLCGTPVIASDWGAFTETVAHGISGFRCRTMDEFVWAGMCAAQLDRTKVREYAMDRYSTDVTGPQYAAYLNKVQNA